MGISFDGIPAGIRTHGSYIEFNKELAGATSAEFNLALMGQRLSSGSVAAGVPTRVTDPGKAAEYFGTGSQLHRMCTALLSANSTIPLTVIALDDDPAGTAAAGTITVDTEASAAGTLYVYIGEQKVSVGVAVGDAVATIASNIAAKINADTTMPVTASASAAVVTVTARHKGESFNDLMLHTNYHGQAMPTGLTLTIVSLSGGTGNPDATVAIDAMGDTWYNWVIFPYTDGANISALTAELDERYNPLTQKGCRGFTCVEGTHSETGTYGSGLNKPHLTVLGNNSGPRPVYEVCAINGGDASLSLADDPARPLQGLELTGMLAPAPGLRWTREERDMLLYDGIATYTVDNDGTCRIERQITTYQRDDSGLPDASYLDIQTVETLERVRLKQRTAITQKYPRHKLAEDGTNYSAGQAIVTPSLVKATLLDVYREMEALGWVEDFETYKANLIVMINPDDPNRVDWRDTPLLVNQARVFAGKSQFIL